MESKEPVVVFQHQDKKLIFGYPNKFCEWRAKTLLTKEPETIGWLRSFDESDIFWDVGANVGLYSIYAAVVKGCKTFSFEPESQNFALLNKNIYFNKVDHLVHAYSIGISDKAGILDLNLSKFETGYSGHSLGGNKTIFNQGCLSHSIDELVDMGIPCPTHLKIDIDGLEHLVIEGCRNTIDKIKTVLIELEHKNPNHIELIGKMQSLGFTFDPAQVARTARPDGGLFEDYREYIFKRH